MKVVDFISPVSSALCGAELWKAVACLTRGLPRTPSLSLYIGFIIRSSCQASLMVTWSLNAHSLFIKVPLWKGQRNGGVTRERNEREPRVRKGENGRETESLLAAMLKVCSSYSADREAPPFPQKLFLTVSVSPQHPPPCPLFSKARWFQVTGWLRVKQDCTLGNSPRAHANTHTYCLYLSPRHTYAHNMLTHWAFDCRPH